MGLRDYANRCRQARDERDRTQTAVDDADRNRDGGLWGYDVKGQAAWDADKAHKTTRRGKD